MAFPDAVRAQRGEAPAPKFGKDMLKCAEEIDGLRFTNAEDEMAVAGVSRNLDSYEELRKLDVPLDTEPAVTFRPYLPGKQPAGRSTRSAKLAVARPKSVPVTSPLEELAFEPVTSLATLIEGRKISSTDLTTPYDEATMLRVALGYERATKWHTMNPPLEENLRKMKTADDAVQAGPARPTSRSSPS